MPEFPLYNLFGQHQLSREILLILEFIIGISLNEFPELLKINVKCHHFAFPQEGIIAEINILDSTTDKPCIQGLMLILQRSLTQLHEGIGSLIKGLTLDHSGQGQGNVASGQPDIVKGFGVRVEIELDPRCGPPQEVPPFGHEVSLRPDKVWHVWGHHCQYVCDL